jgi:phenylacetate-CoA ligase
MPDFMDRLETRAVKSRELALYRDLKTIIAVAKPRASGLRRLIRAARIAEFRGKEELAQFPVLRGSDMARLREQEPPFGGFNATRPGLLRRLFPTVLEGHAKDWWGCARAMHAAGFTRGDIILNSFSYHLSAAGHMIESGAQALGCAVIPAGSSMIERQLDAIETLRPNAFCGKAAFLDLLLQKAAELRRDVSSIQKAFVFGAPLSQHLRASIEARGVRVHQGYATSMLGVIAYETDDENGAVNVGMVVNEGVIVEIVRPGANEPAPAGEIGEVVVTRLNLDCPMLRCSTGDLSMIMPDPSPCGRTNIRIKGWLGRADQAALMANRTLLPSQVIDIGARHAAVRRLRLVLRNENAKEALLLRAEAPRDAAGLASELSASLKDVTGLDGAVELVEPGDLPDDGKLIVDERALA